MQQMNRRVLLQLIIIMILITSVPVFAEGEDDSAEQQEQGNQEDEIIEVVEEDIESNFISKEYYIDGEDDSNYLVEGGNEDAVNMLATEQSTASGTLTENSNIEGEDFDMTVPTDEEYEEKNPLELRQFISFETKSGKVFHLIIDHGKDSDNVRMLTEVSEQDLLNLIEDQANIEIELVEGQHQTNKGEEIEQHKEPENSGDAIEDVEDGTSVSEEPPMNTQTMVIIGVSVIAAIAGWYFKIYKPKQDAMYEDEVDEADYIDEEMINEDDEDDE